MHLIDRHSQNTLIIGSNLITQACQLFPFVGRALISCGRKGVEEEGANLEYQSSHERPDEDMYTQRHPPQPINALRYPSHLLSVLFTLLKITLEFNIYL